MLRVTFKTMTLIELRFLRKHSDLTGSDLTAQTKFPKWQRDAHQEEGTV